jgi:hypothetical protein
MLGRLEKGNLRSVWTNESAFSQWLSEEENLNLLGEEIGVELSLLATEADAGDFRIDILAQEENTGKKIVIENQLEPTNHDHLGKLLTYGSVQDASLLIWIVRDVREEHRKAIDWLNNHTDEKLNFFLVKIEIWRIGESKWAPKFEVVSRPNEWVKLLARSSTPQHTKTQILQLEYWTKFIEYTSSAQSPLRLRAPRPQHWYVISYGNSKSQISLTINTQRNVLGCDIYIPNSKELYHKIREHKEDIESELGTELQWMVLPSKKASRIKSSYPLNIKDRDNWGEAFEWMQNKAESFRTVFSKYV